MTTKKLPNIPDLGELHRWWEMRDAVLRIAKFSYWNCKDIRIEQDAAKVMTVIDGFDREQPEDLTGETK
jgi:hypothetical protein